MPVLDPKQWFDLARCKYDAPVDFGSEVLLKQNVESERCAIYRYQQIAEFTNGIDFTTCDIAKHIMAEEEDHEQDLQDYLNDIARMKAYILKNSHICQCASHRYRKRRKGCVKTKIVYQS